MKQKGKASQPAVESGELTEDVKTRIDVALKRRLVEVARREDRSESAIMRRALREYLGAES